jgi:hypothetical protein
MGNILYIGLGIIGLFLLAVAVYFIWVTWQTRPRRPKEDGYRYIFVEDNGTAREVTSDEREFLEMDFDPFDGARPYIKTCYATLNGYGGLSGYLPRRQLPENIPIAPPKDNTSDLDSNQVS